MTPRSAARNSGPLTQQTESHLHTICIQCKLKKKLEDDEKTASVLVSFASIMEISKQEKEEKHLKRSGVRIHCCNPSLIFPVQGSQFKANSPRFSSGSPSCALHLSSATYSCFTASLKSRPDSTVQRLPVHMLFPLVLTRPNCHVLRRYQLVLARNANHNNGGVHFTLQIYTPIIFNGNLTPLPARNSDVQGKQN